MGLQQSERYLKFVRKLGWDTADIDGVYLISKSLPLVGRIAKMQRCEKLPDIKKLVTYLKKNKVKNFALEPESNVSQDELTRYAEILRQNKIHLNKSPFLATKTIRLNLNRNPDIIFNSFTESKRRAVRRALKHQVTIKNTDNIRDLIKIKNKSAGFFGFMTTYGIKKLWESFRPDAKTILAYDAKSNPIGGVLLIINNGVSYYWIAGATRRGKKFFAPTFLVWEALKLSRILGAKFFDFVGVWDERLPKYSKEWLGFTKFKEGFGGETVYYPILR